MKNQRQCTMFVMAMPFGEKASMISNMSCELVVQSLRDELDPYSFFLCRPQLRFSYSDDETIAHLAAFTELPLSKAALYGKSLSSSIGKDNYIWYSCALEAEQSRRKPVYHNLTAVIHYRKIETRGWITSAHSIVSLLARSLALEEIRSSYVTQQSKLPLEERELENILKSALTCLVCEIPGKILVNDYLELSIQQQFLVGDFDWNVYSLCFYTLSENVFNDMFHFPYAKILSLLFRYWDPSKCLIDIVREYLIDFDKTLIVAAINRGRAYQVVDYIAVLAKSVQFLVYENIENGMEQLWLKVSKIHETLLVGLFSIEESFFVLEMISRGHTIAEVLNNFDPSFERSLFKYIGILESMQVIQRI